MDVFNENSPNLIRQVFGKDSISGDILVPINLVVSNASPLQFGQPGEKILAVSNNALVGTVKDFDIPQPGSNINSIISLDPGLPIDPAIKVVQPVDHTGVVADTSVLILVNNTPLTGKILPPLSGSSTLINTFPFPLSMSFTINAYRIKFNVPLGKQMIGSPISMLSGYTLGMLLTDGKTVFVFPS